MNRDGLLQCAQRFVEEGMWVDLTASKNVLKLDVNDLRDLYQALVLGIRDYFRKVGFSNE